jgi:hypothetical protein
MDAFTRSMSDNDTGVFISGRNKNIYKDRQSAFRIVDDN